jgi:hypothetical protein
MKKLFVSGFAVVAVLGAAFAFDLPPFSSRGQTQLGDINTTAAVAAAGWADNVDITVDAEANTFRFQSNGLPAHGFAEKYLIPNDVASQPFADNTPDEFTVVASAAYFKETAIDTTITTLPFYSEETTPTSLGRIGVALSGAQLFNDYEDRAMSIVAMDDNVIHDHVPFVDECNGHTLVDGTNYHYHGIPVCIAEAATTAGEHSVMIGVLEDGFPVYANQGQGGVTITNADLDECCGHFEVTPEFPDGIYHYHLTADEAPYMIDCYHGTIETSWFSG